MKFALVGVGHAGGRVVDQIRALEANTSRSFTEDNVLVIDTHREDFLTYDHVPANRHVLIGDTHPEAAAEGVDADPDLGAAIAQEELHDVTRAFDAFETHEVDAILLAAGFAGGTGSGAGAVVLEQLQEIYEKPVYVLGVLPHSSEGERAAHTAARSIRSFVPVADNVVLFDNDSWHSGNRPLEDSYEEMNEAAATRLVSLLAAGERDGSSIAETRVDSSDIARVLATGGVSSIGYASVDAGRGSGGLLGGGSGGLLSRLLGTNTANGDEPATDAAKIKKLVRNAVTDGHLTVPCDISTAERVALVLSGPPGECSRKGFESARYWLESETGSPEIRAGDEPTGGSTVTASVLLSNVTDVPRVEQLQNRATGVEPGTE